MGGLSDCLSTNGNALRREYNLASTVIARGITMKLGLLIVSVGLLLCLLLGSGWAAAAPALAQSSSTLPACSASSGYLAVSPFFEVDQTLFSAGHVVWRTTDGDTTWQAVFQVPAGYSPRAIRIAPARSITGLQVYFGYVENSDPYPQQFFTHSADGGETWEVPWPDQLTESCMQEGVTNELGVLFSSCMTLWPPQGDPSIDGIHRSLDHGHTWERIWTGGKGVWDVIPSPNYHHDQTVFAVRLGVYPDANPYPMVSTDSGAMWHDLSFGSCPIQSNANINNIFVSPGFAEDQTIFGRTRNEHLLKSEDGGQTWQNIYPRSVPICEPSWDFIGEVALSPDYESDQTIFMRTSSGFYISYDDGRQWHQLLDDGQLGLIQVRRRPAPSLRFSYLPLAPQDQTTVSPPKHNLYLPLLIGHNRSPHPIPITIFAYHWLTGYNYRSDDGGLTWRCLNLPPS